MLPNGKGSNRNTALAVFLLEPFPLGSMLLYAARTFLLQLNASDEPVWLYKINEDLSISHSILIIRNKDS